MWTVDTDATDLVDESLFVPRSREGSCAKVQERSDFYGLRLFARTLTVTVTFTQSVPVRDGTFPTIGDRLVKDTGSSRAGEE